MRRFMFMLALLLTAALSPAQSNSVRVGYCNGRMAESTGMQLSGKGWTECALRLPSSVLSAYKGSGIVAVRAALLSRVNTDTLRVWVRKTLDGPNMAQGTVLRNGSPSITVGWNEVKFDSPYMITGGSEDVYVGYSLHQKSNVRAVSIVSPSVVNTSYIKLGDGEWTDVSLEGVLSIEALVSGDNVPAYDLGVVSSTITPDLSEGRSALRVEATVNNFGSSGIKGFTLSCSAPGVGAVSHHFDDGIASSSSLAVAFSFDPGVDTDSNTPWTVAVESIDGGEDEIAGNNSVSPLYTFFRNVLIEEFTTERCSNCPGVASLLQETLKDKKYADNTFMITRHAGFYTDKFTLPCDEELLWIYEGNFAPAVIVDRRPMFTNSSGNATVSFIPQYVEQVKSVLDHEREMKTNVALGLALAFSDDSTKVTVTVTGMRNAAYSTKSPRLNVYLTEDDIRTDTQQGFSGAYLQQHVNRAYNSICGEPVEWYGNMFEYSCTFDIESSWVKKNMHALAFLYNYDQENKNNCVVDNSACVPLVTASSVTSISSRAEAGIPEETGRYAVDGRISGRNDKGLCIIKYSDGTVKKVFKK